MYLLTKNNFPFFEKQKGNQNKTETCLLLVNKILHCLICVAQIQKSMINLHTEVHLYKKNGKVN